jgi:ABC-type bacteriocin/lantibiotic exporter with double-glycine peptidase domain
MKEKITPFKRLIKLLSLDKKDLYQILFYSIFYGFVSLSLPLGIQSIINLIQGGRVSLSWIVLVLVVVIGVIFLGILQILQLRITENIQQKIFIRSSFEFAYRFPKFKFHSYYNDHLPELANRFFDTIGTQKGVSKLILDYSSAFLQIIFGLILLSLYHPFFILFGFFLFILLYLIFRFSFDKGLETSLKESKFKYKVANWLQEIAHNNVTFKNNSKHEFALQRNDYLTDKYLYHRESHFKVLVNQYKQMIAFKVILTAGLLLVGGFLVINQQMNIGQFVAAEIIILLVINSVEKIILGIETLYDVLTSIEKIGLVTDMEMEEESTHQPTKDCFYKIQLELENIAFRFPDSKEDILKNIHLTIKPGEKIFLDGVNGSGKTTLLRIIGGLIQPSKGLFYVNDDSLRKLDLDAYRCQIGMVTTGQALFHGTILENITLNDPEISNERVKEMIQVLHLKDFIKAHPNGLDAQVFPDGKLVPSSVAQKIILARVLIKNPKILILEEPMDHLDAQQEMEIIDYLTDAKHPWTLLVTSRNNYWKQKSQRQIILEKGTIVADIKNK